jgi:sulfite reductase (NADPH) hemoprotein beta-component
LAKKRGGLLHVLPHGRRCCTQFLDSLLGRVSRRGKNQSSPIAQELSRRFAGAERQRQIGDMKIKISGCINACGHHHVGHIGILGLEKSGSEAYQITLGGSADETCAVGAITGRSFSSDEIVDAIETVVDTYLKFRAGSAEDFLAAYRRIGMEPFKEALYGRQ